jgi:hypothetical protein
MAKTYIGDYGTLGQSKGIVTHDFMEIGNKVHRIHKVVVHRFRLADAEDPDLYAAQPLYEWQQSEMGKFIMAKAVDTPEWHRNLDHTTYGYQYAVVAKLKDVDYTFWTLKWSNQVDRQGIYTV